VLSHFEPRLARKMLRDFPVVRAMDLTGDVLQDAKIRLITVLRKLT
jgi:hypothetical protein